MKTLFQQVAQNWQRLRFATTQSANSLACEFCHIANPELNEQGICSECFKSLIKPNVRFALDGTHNIYSICNFPEAIKSKLYSLKFYNNPSGLNALNQLIVATFGKHFLDWTQHHACIVPIPPHTQNPKQGQVLKLFKPLAQKYPLAIITDALEWQRQVVPQHTLKSRKERLENIRNAFKLSKPDSLLPYKHVIVVDDICTTGATLKNAIATIESFKDLSQNSSQNITALSLCHVPFESILNY